MKVRQSRSWRWSIGLEVSAEVVRNEKGEFPSRRRSEKEKGNGLKEQKERRKRKKKKEKKKRKRIGSFSLSL